MWFVYIKLSVFAWHKRQSKRKTYKNRGLLKDMEPYEKELALVKKVLKENPKGMTVSDISREIRINRNSVAKYLDILLISGHVEMRTIGPAKVFSLSHRVPLSAMLNFSSDYMLVLDKDLKVVQVNDNLLDLMKVERESLLGRDIEDCPFFAEMTSKIKYALDGKDSTTETSFRPAKKEFYFRIKMVPTTFDDGEPGVTILVENTTEQKKAEEKIKLFSDAIEGSIDGMVILDMEGIITYVNPATYKLLGYEKGELIGKHVTVLHADPEEAEQITSTLMKTGGWSGEVLSKKKNKETFPTLLSISTVKDRKGKPIAILGINRDITKRKEVERALEESERKFRTIFENVNDMIAYLDKRGKILDMNKKVEDVLGYRRDEVVGKNFAKIGVLGAKDLPRMLRLFMDLLRGNRTMDKMELEIRDRKGKRVTIEANVKIAKKDGKKEGLVVIIRKTKGNRAKVIS
jgi:PAS domain S-box-containing protein